MQWNTSIPTPLKCGHHCIQWNMHLYSRVDISVYSGRVDISVYSGRVDISVYSGRVDISVYSGTCTSIQEWTSLYTVEHAPLFKSGHLCIQWKTSILTPLPKLLTCSTAAERQQNLWVCPQHT